MYKICVTCGGAKKKKPDIFMAWCQLLRSVQSKTPASDGSPAGTRPFPRTAETPSANLNPRLQKRLLGFLCENGLIDVAARSVTPK